jgi:branched-chain amino acid aminotransferase
VAECTSANIFAANGNHVRTPPLSSGCLPGITRELLLGEVAIPGIQVEESTLKPADLENADEVFITSTTRDLLPVGRIEGHPLGEGGQVCAQLRAAFAEYTTRYVADHRGAALPSQAG